MPRIIPLLLALVLTTGAAIAQPFNLPSQLDVASINGVTPPDTGSVVTSSRTVAVNFATDANAAFVWIVQPTGTTGGSTVFPPGDATSALIPFGSENQPFDLRLCITAIAPSFVLTGPNRTFCGQGASVTLDTQAPEITLLELVQGDQRQPVTASSQVRVNGDFTVVGTVRDNVAPAEEIQLSVSIAGQESAVTVEPSGRFEAAVSVGGLSDGSYDVELIALDSMDDTSPPNRASLTMGGP